MIKNITLIALILLRVFYQPSATTNEGFPSFINPGSTPLPIILSGPAKVVSIKGTINKNKIVLKWVVSENESAAQFEVEKSYNGKNFTMAALVFGTDKTDSDSYLFYEKRAKGKVQYRIKIVNKNQTIGYSSAVEINPIP